MIIIGSIVAAAGGGHQIIGRGPDLQAVVVLAQLGRVPFTQFFRYDVLDAHSGPSRNQIVLAISTVVHIPGPHEPSDVPVFIL